MFRIRDLLIEIARQPATALLLDIAVKGTALMLLAMLLLRLLPRSSAALRHWVWSLAFCGLIFLPALCYVLPGLALPILPAWTVAELSAQAPDQVAAAQADAREPVAEKRQPADPFHGGEIAASGSQPSHLTLFDPPTNGSRIADKKPLPRVGVATTAAAPDAATTEQPSAAILPPALFWAVGAAVALLPLLAGLARSLLLRATAQNIQDTSWIALRDQLCARLGLNRSVRLLQVQFPIIPLSCGVLRPAVILPTDAYRWDEPLRRFVLLHELSHIKRHDVVFQLIARLACALYWFHPLVWYALYRLRVERELACDDSVLAAGERPSDYAEQLLEVARRLQPLRLHAAVAMAQSNKLEYRVSELFSQARSHLPLSNWTSRLLLACTAVVVLTVSMVRPGVRATEEDVPNNAETTSRVKQPVTEPERSRSGVIHGRVVTPDGRPAVGAEVLVVDHSEDLLGRRVRSRNPLQRITADNQGRFSATVPTRSAEAPIYLLAKAPGYGPAWEYPETFYADQECLLKLVPDDVPLEGRVLDLEGRPIEGVTVTLRSMTASADDIEAWLMKARKNPTQRPEETVAYSTFYGFSNLETTAEFPASPLPDFVHPELRQMTTTDAGGRFRLIGLGSKRMIGLEFRGAGVATSWVDAVTHPMTPVPLPRSDPRYAVTTCFGARFDVALAPHQLIRGVVRDESTKKPLAGAGVSLFQFAGSTLRVEGFITDIADAQGRYELTGIPRPGDDGRTRLRVVPSADQPYFRTDVEVAPSNGHNPVEQDISLKRAIWITGRVVDEETGKPVQGSVAYYPFLSNELAKDYANFDPGVQGIGDDYHYPTSDDGSFRLPGLPGQGILAFLADADTHYPLAQGADMIGGLRRQSSSEKRLVYYFMTADMVNAVREVNPPAGVEEFRCEIRLSSFKPHKVRLLDPNGQELIGARAAGLTRFPLRGSRGVRPPQTSAIVDVLGLSEDQPRTLLFEHRERNLAAIATLSVGDFPDKQPKDVRLLPAASITLRLVDGEDRPVADGHAYVGLAGDEERLLHAIGNPVQTNDQIVINRLPPNVKYTLRGYSTQNNLAITRQVGPLKPGEQFDLGEVKLTANAEGTSPQQADGPSSDQTSSRAESSPAKNKLVTSEKATQPEKVNEADSTTSAGDGAAIGESGMATVRGQIVRPDGRPAATAHVAAIARRIVVGRGADLTPNGDALGEATADEMGRYELMLPINVAETHRDAYLLARADGTALSWQKLNLDAANVEASFKLKPAEPLTGRLVDLEGQPAAGVQLTIQSLQRTVLGFAIPIDGVGLPRSKSLPTAWPPPVTSDEQGRFTIDGAPAGYGVVLTVGGNDRFAPQELAFNTGMHETRGERDATYRPQFVKNAKPGEDIVAPLAPAQIFAGRVTYEDTGEGAPFAPVQIWASQQQFGGSMISIGGRADAEGRYRLNPHPGVRFGLTAYAPKSAPYLSRRTNDIVWESGAREKEINLKLPRGVDVRGQVIEEVSGKPVAAASVQYVPEELYNPNVRDDILTGWQAIEPTDAQGRFEIVVLPGPGRLLVHGPDGRFVLREISSGELYKGQRGGRRNYVHGIARIEPEKAAEPLAVTIRLERGSAVRGELVDEQGTSIDEALMISRLYISPYSLFWRGFPQSVLGGRFELGGLAPGQEYPVHFIDPKRRLGATVRLKAGTDASRVVLVPCGSAVMRFVDEKGNGIAGHNPTVKLVVTPGTLDWNRTAEEAKTLAADEDFIANIDRLNHGRLYADAEGRVELPALIPGANYRVTTVRNEKLVVAKDFQAKSGETIDLGDIVYERGEK